MDTGKQKVLVVDDDPNVLDLLKSGIEAMGYSVLTCDNTGAVGEALEGFKPDIILLDIGMPGVDGISLCRSLKLSRETADIPIVMITAFTDDKTRHDAMLFGANGFLTKPFELSGVKKKLEECLAKTSNKKENQK